ncbi:MAG: aminomethyl-transferring glycine dehydrogenase subunit GcvPB [Candidatus Eiseniibacteriota bacterium]|nr:MAG: aminomethyl-transferring glycine dehydrogenase subunit GcvPB [Candidatus Eisenbacteria bacterium]
MDELKRKTHGEPQGEGPRLEAEPLLSELHSQGHGSFVAPALDVPAVRAEDAIPSHLLRKESQGLPELSEPEVVRHFTRLSSMNYHVDKGMYPLGSCTMKYNPKLNEEVASWPGFAGLHPLSPLVGAQGALELMCLLDEALRAVTGMSQFCLHPAAGAHGELAGMMMVAAYHRDKKNEKDTVIIPDSAHGTNPASVNLAGYRVAEVKSGKNGCVSAESLRQVADERTAALMLTNPNTLGLFEEEVLELAEVLHGLDGLMYLDGANLNALLGVAKPADMGFDVVHINLHKTFSTPHGGGGPGSGPLGVNEKLRPFLPVPRVEKEGTRFVLRDHEPKSIGRIHSFYGNFAVMVKAYAYILSLGGEGLEAVSRESTLNANYLKALLAPHFELPYDRPCMHEFVLSGSRQKEAGVRTLDVAKRLLDYGFHAPTVYFPLIVDEALMIEPTETETKRELDRFAEAMQAIAEEARKTPEVVKLAPVATPVGRLDEGKAARELRLKW